LPDLKSCWKFSALLFVRDARHVAISLSDTGRNQIDLHQRILSPASQWSQASCAAAVL
jgi:hypothetical protein